MLNRSVRRRLRTAGATRIVVSGLVAAALVAAALVAVPVAPVSADPTAPTSPAASAGVEGSVITPAATELVQGRTLTVDYTTEVPDPTNWIGVYPAGSAPGSVPSTQWQYVTEAEGSVSFPGLGAGDWDVYLLAKDGYDVLAGPVTVRIVPDPDAPQPGDPGAPVEVDPVETSNRTDEVVLREGFAPNGAEGWTVAFDERMAGEGSDAFRGWQFLTRGEWTSGLDGMRGRFGRAHETVAVADAQQFGNVAFRSVLTSEPVPASGLGEARLTFASHYRGAAGQSGVVRVSFDGGEPVELLRLDSATVADGYDGRQLNYTHDVTFPVPRGPSGRRSPGSSPPARTHATGRSIRSPCTRCSPKPRARRRRRG